MENNVSPAKSGISYMSCVVVLEFVIMYVIGMKS
jgi:hypothetical protein